MWEVIFFIVFAGLLVGSWLLMKGVGKWFWSIMFAVIAATVAITEGIAYLMTHHTISQLFWIYSQSNPKGAWTILALVTVGWLLFMAHLSEKLWGKKKA